MSLCKSETIFINIVAVSALNLRHLVAAADDHRNRVNPENILHARAGDRTAILLSQCIETIDLSSARRPRINCFLAGRYDADATAYALLNMVINIMNEAEQCYNCDIRITLIKHLIRIV